MQIEITEETAKAILMIEDRYYFDLFEQIRTQVSEEYQMRNAIIEIAQEIRDPGVKR